MRRPTIPVDEHNTAALPKIGQTGEVRRDYAYTGKFEQLVDSEWRPDIAGFRGSDCDMTRSNSKTIETSENDLRKKPFANTELTPL